jgi:hypothetical protein
MTTWFVPALVVFPLLVNAQTTAADSLRMDWSHQLSVSRSTPTLQVVVNPPLRFSSAIHDSVWETLRQLKGEYVRYVPWLPYPRLAVAELKPPSNGRCYWDFSLIDPMTKDFLQATRGHRFILNFSTIPAWMFRSTQTVSYPESPDSVTWNYTQGTLPVDSSYQQIAAYYRRLVSWYTRGGFTDECGTYHASGNHFHIPYWEVFNEPDQEHHPEPEIYTREYDAVVGAIRSVSPDTRFVGMALASENDPHWFEYFLNHKNHRPGIPLDMISYHFYAIGYPGQGIESMQYSFFDQANGFLNSVRYIESIRRRLSPRTRTSIDEIGSILSSDFDSSSPEIPAQYWNLSAALYAYLYIQLTRIGIDVIGESQLLGYPSQYPSVSMVNWTSGRGNARYWALKIIRDNLGPGDVLVAGGAEGTEGLEVQGFLTPAGKRILVVNRSARPATLAVPADFRAGQFLRVDPSSGERMPAPESIGSKDLVLGPFGVAILRP